MRKTIHWKFSSQICKYSLSYQCYIYPCTQTMIYPEEAAAILEMEEKLKKLEKSLMNIDDAKKCMSICRIIA